jgi:hypothetical protein
MADPARFSKGRDLSIVMCVEAIRRHEILHRLREEAELLRQL